MSELIDQDTAKDFVIENGQIEVADVVDMMESYSAKELCTVLKAAAELSWGPYNDPEHIKKRMTTKELFEELKKREDVDVMTVCSPDDSYKLGGLIHKGPMTVLKIID